MLYYDRTDISEGIDLAKSNNSKECMICHYWLFNHGFKFQYYVCNDCHDLTMFCLNISDITIITVKNVDYRCIIHNISKYEAINLLQRFCSRRSWVCVRKYCLKFQSIQDSLFFFFCLQICLWPS